ncbi:sensor histidine kinase [Microbacterium telephonicum]|uniref:Signal transduction histidine kinase n=1 Tax=Microbacterium telephonicum TaxID=1714841 RepID=A0A498C4T2_9MICO|nr:ATP-binding protein [Microbacterium telephonicum]RLK47778.1 signal transduction histidine kinase [Microbacterium telephonicum]
MSTDAPVGRIDPDVRRALSGISAGAANFTRARMERILEVVVAGGTALLGVQSLLNAFASTQESPTWHGILLITAFAPWAVMIAALLTGRGVRASTRVFAIVMPLVLVCWPIATAGRDPGVGSPWVWYMLNVVSAATVFAFSVPLQIVWAAGVPVVYVVARLIQLGFPAGEIILVVLDGMFAMILGGVIVALGMILRSVAAQIDLSRRETVASYAAAAAAEAAEKERVAVAALMHDSVLAALISSERAATEREETLAVAMAREALTRLANADRDANEGSDEPIEADLVIARLQKAIDDFHVALTVDVTGDASTLRIPGRVASALVLAATQAIANSVQHAGASGMEVQVRVQPWAIGIRISDRGPGFDPTAVPDDRLGIRGSINARMAAVAGRARVLSGPGGTVVALDWGRSS